MSDWQSIDTAPRDGTRVLVVNGRRQAVAHWREGGAIPGGDVVDAQQWRAGWVDENGDALDPPPTMWASLSGASLQPPDTSGVDT